MVFRYQKSNLHVLGWVIAILLLFIGLKFWKIFQKIVKRFHARLKTVAPKLSLHVLFVIIFFQKNCKMEQRRLPSRSVFTFWSFFNTLNMNFQKFKIILFFFLNNFPVKLLRLLNWATNMPKFCSRVLYSCTYRFWIVI